MIFKKCPQCKIEKFEDEFFKIKEPRWKGDEYASWCKVCNRRRHRKRYLKHRKGVLKHKAVLWREMTLEQRERRLKSTRLWIKKRREKVIKHYGSRCKCCGETKIEFLEMDHINNDGAAHRRKLGYPSMYGWIVKNNYPKTFQILCSNCNMSKGRYGYCPHKKL